MFEFMFAQGGAQAAGSGGGGMAGGSAGIGGGGGAGGMLSPKKLLDVAGTMLEGYAAKEAHEYNAQVARINADLVRRQAVIDVTRIRRTGAKVIGAATAAYGASGVAAEGSALDVLAESAMQVEFDVQMTKWNASVQAISLENQARLQESAATNAMTGAVLSSFGQLLG